MASVSRATAVDAPSAEGRLLAQYWKVQLLFNPVITATLALAVSPPGAFWRSFGVSMTIAFVTSSLSFAVLAIVMGFERRARQRGSPRIARGRLWYLGWALGSMPLGMLLSGEITLRAFGLRAPASVADYRLGVCVGIAIGVVFSLWYARRDAEHAARLLELRLEQAQALTLQAQLSTLSAQLNPHLLFNALNTVAALIASDPERAEQTVVRLAELYRGVLAATRRSEHALLDELELCAAYLDVERARFGERLTVAFEVDPTLDAAACRVPVLILQPLVENAVTHGLAGRARGGSVRVHAGLQGDALRLEVVDDGVGLGRSSQRGAGLGIDTTRQRLALGYGRAASLALEESASGGTRAVVCLPYRELPRQAAEADLPSTQRAPSSAGAPLELDAAPGSGLPLEE